MTPTPEPADERAALRSRVEAGEWLGPSDVSRLLGISRSSIVRMMNAEPPTLRSKKRISTGKHRIVHPQDVLAELQAQGGDDESLSPS